MKRIHLLLIFIIKTSCYSQTQQYWPFGEKFALRFEKKSFHKDTFCQLDNNEGTSSIYINDSSFFYSDGISIYNKHHKRINIPSLQSDQSSTQGSLMLKHQDNDSVVFMITNSALGDSICPSHYYEFKIENDSVLRLLRSKVLTNYGSEKLSAVYHRNGKDIWIITHAYYGNMYSLYLLKRDGLIQFAINHYIGSDYQNFKYPAAGQIKFSPNGKYVASSGYTTGNVDLFRFNNETGQIEDSVYLNLYSYGVEFSGNSQKVYFSNFLGQLIQYSLENWDEQAIDGSSILVSNSGVKKISALQLSLDKKIYWNNFDSLYLAAINSPDSTGIKSNVDFRSIYLSGRKSNAGLPSFNQSVFYTPSIDFCYDMDCETNTVSFWSSDTFSASAFQWRIKKMNQSNSEGSYSSKDIVHQFSDTGIYQIRFIAGNGGNADTVIKTITLYPKLKRDFLGRDTVYPSGSAFQLMLKVPSGSYCQLWQDSSSLSAFDVDTAGVYYCKVTNSAFCQEIDTIFIRECSNSLIVPSLYRSKDTLFTYHQIADSFVWYLNDKQYRITKTPFIKLTDTGLYRVEAAKNGYCNRSSSTFYINKVGLNRLTLEDFGVRFYPNPTDGALFFKSEKPFNLKVYDATGKLEGKFESPTNVELSKGVKLLFFEVNGNLVFERVYVL